MSGISLRTAVALSAVLMLTALLAPLAAADNRRISISDYSWSDPEIELDLGEHVTWYWTGPDLMHSVTGQPPSAVGLDSDPQTNQPRHKLGDSFQLAFDQPGTFELQCKLHSTVGGFVTVSDTPGDPVAEPDPVPRNNVDLTPPRLRELQLGARKFGRRGTSFAFSLGERSRVSAEFFRYDADDRRRFAGFQTWRGYVGFNGVRIANRTGNFRPRPGSYLAVIAAIDQVNNTATERRLRFRIRRR